MDGYSFIITLFIRDFIKYLFLNAHTAKKKINKINTKAILKFRLVNNAPKFYNLLQCI